METFLHSESDLPQLIQIGLAHAQFETIHPFLDGNGRIGRLLITLYLVSKGLLAKPSLYLSDFFERNRGSYYDALTRVRASNDLIHWVKFFLRGVAETAHKGRDTFGRILQLRVEVDGKLASLGKRAPNAARAVALLYRSPVQRVTTLADSLGLTHQTANSILKSLNDLGVVRETTGGARYRTYAFEPYIRLFVV